MTRVEANRLTRAKILRVVRRYGTGGISYEGLERVFSRAGMLGVAADLEEHLQYLADKKYLAKDLRRDELSGVERWLVWITPTGIDLLEGTIEPDPGVELVC